MVLFTVFYAIFRNISWKLKNNKGVFAGLETESFWRKFLAIISGYKVRLSSLEKGHLEPLEDIEINDERERKRKLLVFPSYEEHEDIVSRLKENDNERNGWVWVTPGLPLLIFITAGLIVALAYGDLVWFLISSLLA